MGMKQIFKITINYGKIKLLLLYDLAYRQSVTKSNNES